MKGVNKCEICGDRMFNFLFNQKDKNINLSGEFSLYACNSCKAIFLNPQPTLNKLKKYYPKEKYYSLNKIDVNSKKFKIKKALYQIYFNPPKNNFLKKVLFSPLKFMVRSTHLNKKGKLLDIGCGSGQFIYEMKSLGLDVYGIEPGDFDKESNNRYKLNIKNTNLLKAKYPREFFDIITINHVIEHLGNPNETLNEINKIIKKKGILIIGIPNTNSLAYKIFKKNWYQLDIPRHLWNYSDKNIKILLEKNGFKILKIRYNSRPSQFSVSLMYFLNIKNKIIEKIFWAMFLPFTWIANFLKIGDQIEVKCIKKDNLQTYKNI